MGMYDFVGQGMELQRLAVGLRREVIIERMGRPIGRDDRAETLTWQIGKPLMTAHFKDGVVDRADVSVAAEAPQKMPVHQGHVDGFGCATCMSHELGPNGLQNGAPAFNRRLIDDSHFIASLLRCATCRQDFLQIFTELIDWVDSDDSQCRVIVPLTVTEATALQPMDEVGLARAINGLNMSRPHLSMIYPKGGAKSVNWRTGRVILSPHD